MIPTKPDRGRVVGEGRLSGRLHGIATVLCLDGEFRGDIHAQP